LTAGITPADPPPSDGVSLPDEDVESAPVVLVVVELVAVVLVAVDSVVDGSVVDGSVVDGSVVGAAVVVVATEEAVVVDDGAVDEVLASDVTVATTDDGHDAGAAGATVVGDGDTCCELGSPGFASSSMVIPVIGESGSALAAELVLLTGRSVVMAPSRDGSGSPRAELAASGAEGLLVSIRIRSGAMIAIPSSTDATPTTTTEARRVSLAIRWGSRPDAAGRHWPTRPRSASPPAALGTISRAAGDGG
jgi:hypothetical protein